MKIIKFGQVIVSAEGVRVTGFTIDNEYGEQTKDSTIGVMEWARDQLEQHIVEAKE